MPFSSLPRLTVTGYSDRIVRTNTGTKPCKRWQHRCKVIAQPPSTEDPTTPTPTQQKQPKSDLLAQLQRLSAELEHLKNTNNALLTALQTLDETVEEATTKGSSYSSSFLESSSSDTRASDSDWHAALHLVDGVSSSTSSSAHEYYDNAPAESSYTTYTATRSIYTNTIASPEPSALEPSQPVSTYLDPPNFDPPAPDPSSPPPKPKNRLNIVFAAAEVAPWSKTGGLGDVMSALPPALAAQGHRVMVVAPRYWNPETEKRYAAARDTGVMLRLDMQRGGQHDIRYYHERREGVDFVFVDHISYHRPGTPYGTAEGPFADNMTRFAILSMAAVEAPLNLQLSDYGCGSSVAVPGAAAAAEASGEDVPSSTYGQEVVFVSNDWHTALVPVYISARLRPYGVYEQARSLLALHNTAHQGQQPASDFGALGLPDAWYGALEWVEPNQQHRTINILKAGIVACDRLVTVSQAYAQEVVTAPQENQLQLLLAQHKERLYGIVNGVDTSTWDPSNDSHLEATYSAADLRGKALCKRALQEQLELEPLPGKPLLGFIGRLDYQKGPDLVLEALPELLDMGCQVVLLGSGAPDYEQRAKEAAAAYPHFFAAHVGFSEQLAHQIIAGCDILLMPSRFEPCGLNQLYAMRYGTVPVAHATGGLRDTIDDYHPFAQVPGQYGSGWTFQPAELQPFVAAVRSAVRVYRERPGVWRQVQAQGMWRDCSWGGAAAQYETVLHELMHPVEAEVEAAA